MGLQFYAMTPMCMVYLEIGFIPEAYLDKLYSWNFCYSPEI